MRRVLLFLPVLLVLYAPGAGAQSAELSVSADDLSAAAPGLMVLAALGDEKLLGEWGAVRWGLEGRGWAFTGADPLAGEIRVRTELSRVDGERVTVGWIAARAAAGSVTGLTVARAELGASFVANGDTVTFTLSPWCAAQAFLDPVVEAGTSLRLAVLAGSVVAEPGLSASVGMPRSGGWTIDLEPGLGFSWYPAFPLQVTLGARWSALVGAAGSLETEWGGTLSAAGAPLPGILLDLSAEAVLGASGVSGTGEAEVAFQLWSSGPRWLSVPLRVAASFTPNASPVVSVGLGLRFGW